VKIQAQRGQSSENVDGTFRVTFHLTADQFGALLSAQPDRDTQLYIADAAAFPAAQRVSPQGADMGDFGATGIPEAAREVVRLISDPVFQNYAITTAGAAPSGVADAKVFALDFVLRRCNAKVPADFDVEGPKALLTELQAAYIAATAPKTE
jgi:hypothetical protein